MYGQPKLDRCFDELNEKVLGYNTKLKVAVAILKAQFSDIKVLYIDIYDSFLDIVRNLGKYGTSCNVFIINFNGSCKSD